MAGYRVLQDDPRRAHLEFFRRHPDPFYSLTFELDATRVRARATQLGASTYAALVWTYHRALSGIDAFRTRLLGEEVVLYDRLRVGMTVPAPRGTFTFATPEWEENAESFLSGARRTMSAASAGVGHGRAPGGGAPVRGPG